MVLFATLFVQSQSILCMYKLSSVDFFSCSVETRVQIFPWLVGRRLGGRGLEGGEIRDLSFQKYWASDFRAKLFEM